ncbi:MAG: hypothetical protein E7318_05535 [Clostridiales bacterium]|nr:hypothetical protein [Clostridiales bacterium]
MRRMIRMLSLFLICSLLLPAALAEDVCVVKDASAVSRVTTSCPYLRVQYPLPGMTNVTLTVRDAWGSLIYQRNYGECSGTFSSRDVHLPAQGESCDYIVTLTTDLGDVSFTVTREQPMLTDTAVYAGGLTLEEMVGGSSYKYAVVLDLCELERRTAVAPMLAGGNQIGEVYFTVEGGSLTVSASLFVEGVIDKANVYIATDAITAGSLGSSRFSGVKTKLDREIRMGGAPYAAVMVQLTVTYDPANAQPFRMGEQERETWLHLVEDWSLMQMMTANEAVG